MVLPSHGAEDFMGRGKDCGKEVRQGCRERQPPGFLCKTPGRVAWSRTPALKRWSAGPRAREQLHQLSIREGTSHERVVPSAYLPSNFPPRVLRIVWSLMN